jgi:very-short-patch-repair endonuclease
MPLYPQSPILNYCVDSGDPWQGIEVEIDGNGFHDQGKDLRRDEELFESGWKVFRIPTAQTRPRYLGKEVDRLMREQPEQAV